MLTVALGLALLTWPVLWASGCTPVRSHGKTAYMVAARYDVEPVFVIAGRRGAGETLRRDFQRIAELGFTVVMLRHVDDADRKGILDIALEAGLRMVIPQRSFDFYAKTGALPDGCGDEPDLVRSVSSAVTGHPSFAAIVVNCAPGRRAAERGAALCTLLRKRGVPGLTIGSLEVESDGRALGAIDVAVAETGQEASLLEHWLAQYHEALMAGRTAGIVFDRYRRPPGDPRGLVITGEPPKPADLAAIKQVSKRARRWGPTLYRTVPEPIANAVVDVDGLGLTALVHGKRRFVLLFNRSKECYAHGKVLLPETISGKDAARAVEVPPTLATVAGRVIEPRGGRISLSVALRPGDAALFEVF